MMNDLSAPQIEQIIEAPTSIAHFLASVPYRSPNPNTEYTIPKRVVVALVLAGPSYGLFNEILGEGPDYFGIASHLPDGSVRVYATLEDIHKSWDKMGVPAGLPAPCPAEAVSEEDADLHIPRSFALRFTHLVRQNPQIDSVYIIGGDQNHHGLIVFRVDGTRQEFHTVDEVMEATEEGLFQLFSTKTPRC